MVRWLLFSFAALLLPLGVFTTWQAPPWTAWRLAVLAGEYGHWLASLALGVAVAAWTTRAANPAVAIATIAIAVTAAAFFVKPAFQAARIAARLPTELDARFGAVRNGATPFSFAALFAGRDPVPARVRTLSVRPGLPFDFYAAAGSRPPAGAPCVVVVHGGGWDAGDRTQLPQLNHWIAQHGCAVAAVSYRLAPADRWPAQRDDVLAAIAFLKSHAAELAIDPTRLVLLGRSAGGQIALVVAYTAADPAIRGVVALYAPSDLVFGYVNTTEDDMIRSPALMRQFLGGTPDTARAAYESASALNFASAHLPPTLLVHGAIDPLVWHRHSVRLEARLAELRVPAAFVSLPWATHGFDYNLHGPGGQLATFALGRFLDAVTK